jgi:glutamyl-tRNA reductase
VIDLAIPQDLSPEIVNHNKVTHISIELLQQISNENLKERSKEIQHVEEIITEALYEFQQIYKMREIELAMRSVPLKVKEIKSAALNEVFKAELDSLDPESRDVLDKVLAYMEKKYMSMPMIMAKEILLNNPTQ